MNWELNNDRPIYTQLVEHLKLLIVTGYYEPGSKLPSVRDIAADAAVNPNTMQKALTELERCGLVFTQRTTGRFITEDEHMINDTKINIANEVITTFLDQMKKLGYTKEETIKLLENE
ncbi:MAG: GntR family transcriptional regulator [Oscillospiraceae bacterium]